MPTFCRHNHLVQNCSICSREQHVEMRPVVTSAAAGASAAPARGARPTSVGGSARARGSSTRRAPGVTVRRLAREADDGYHSGLVPGLRSSAGAERLAAELAFANARLDRLAADPPGLYAEVADAAHDLEERTWLAFQIAYLGPLDTEQPFEAIAAARTTWASGEVPDLTTVATGPRGPADATSGARTFAAYRVWAQRAGSQAAAITGESAWTPERRFARAFERLALPGLDRGARFDLLTTLGRLGAYELEAGMLGFGGSDTVTLAAKRLLGIGDPLLLERRAADVAQACALPVAALDVGFFNWERGERAGLGMAPEDGPDEAALQRSRVALGLN